MIEIQQDVTAVSSLGCKKLNNGHRVQIAIGIRKYAARIAIFYMTFLSILGERPDEWHYICITFIVLNALFLEIVSPKQTVVTRHQRAVLNYDGDYLAP